MPSCTTIIDHFDIGCIHCECIVRPWTWDSFPIFTIQVNKLNQLLSNQVHSLALFAIASAQWVNWVEYFVRFTCQIKGFPSLFATPKTWEQANQVQMVSVPNQGPLIHLTISYLAPLYASSQICLGYKVKKYQCRQHVLHWVEHHHQQQQLGQKHGRDSMGGMAGKQGYRLRTTMAKDYDYVIKVSLGWYSSRRLGCKLSTLSVWVRRRVALAGGILLLRSSIVIIGSTVSWREWMQVN